MTKQIIIKSRDSFIWEQDKTYAEIVQAISTGFDLVLDFQSEGIDPNTLGFFDWLDDVVKYYKYDTSKISITNFCNMIGRHPVYKVSRQPPLSLLEAAKISDQILEKTSDLKPIGCFIGRSNAPRLLIGSYIWKNLNQHAFLTFHYDLKDPWHDGIIGLEEIIKKFNIPDVTDVASFLTQCPIRLQANYENLNQQIDSESGHDGRLLKRDKEIFIDVYKKFFAEVVCESFYSGSTFFPTEKIWRPILLMTPFIVQGPADYVKNLRKLGFRTFHQWWDEGYSEDPPHCQIPAIIDIMNRLCALSPDQIGSMYSSMYDDLLFNRQRLLELTEKDWKCFE